jgi:hypothetical protein
MEKVVASRSIDDGEKQALEMDGDEKSAEYLFWVKLCFEKICTANAESSADFPFLFCKLWSSNAM